MISFAEDDTIQLTVNGVLQNHRDRIDTDKRRNLFAVRGIAHRISKYHANAFEIGEIMNRREFVKNAAVISAGTMALSNSRLFAAGQRR